MANEMRVPLARALLGWLVPLALGSVGCGADGDAGYGSSDYEGTATSGGSTVGGVSATSTTGAIVEPPPEQELEGSYRAPVATGSLLWSANPDSNRVAVIDTDSLAIQIADAGFGPTYMAPIPEPDGDSSSAIVINVLSHDATLFHIDSERELTTTTFPIHAGANRWAVSAEGRWAAAWTDAREVEAPDPTDGFQDVSLVDLAEERVTRLSVGYRPSQVVFDADASRIFVVAEPGISVIDLTAAAPETVDLVEITSANGDPVALDDIAITPDGEIALVREEGQSSVTIVPLNGDEAWQVALSGPVTDLDLSEDGRRAVAVVRSTSEIFVFDLEHLDEEGAVHPLYVPEGSFGSVAVAPHADVAVLYTNAIENHEATIVQLEDGDEFLSHRTVDLKAPIRAVFLAEDGEHAVALLDVPEGSVKQGAFSIVPTKAERAPKIVGTDAPAIAVALVPGRPTTAALVTVRDDSAKLYATHVVSFPGLLVDSFALASPPLATGVMADADLGYVAQSHPEGRVTFLELGSLRARTLTGFELATKVVE
ncbi:MAG TPA: hypothetical protein VNN80_12875 [Polyangiaceae bacterium]|nr:hypothetical protein [Polyangiaceae bacterium]